MVDQDAFDAADETSRYYEKNGKKLTVDEYKAVRKYFEQKGIFRDTESKKLNLSSEDMKDAIKYAKDQSKVMNKLRTKSVNTQMAVNKRAEEQKEKKKKEKLQPIKENVSEQAAQKIQKKAKEKKKAKEFTAKKAKEFTPWVEKTPILPFFLSKKQQPEQYHPETGEKIPAGPASYELSGGAKAAGGFARAAGSRIAKTKTGQKAKKVVIWPFRTAAATVKGPPPIPRSMNPVTAKYNSETRTWSGESLTRPEKPEHLKEGYKKPKKARLRDRVRGAAHGLAQGTPPNRLMTSETRTGVMDWMGRRQEGLSYRLANRKYEKAEKQREAINMSTRMKNIKEKLAPITNMSGTLSRVGFSLPGPFQVFTLAWQKMSSTMKFLIVMIFFLAILFVPWGIFYYAGWAIAAAAMFLISLIYWVFSNLFNAIATGIVGVINGVVTIFMGFIIWVVEAIMGLFISDYHWYNGRGLMQNSLINYATVAQVPNLLTIQAPQWQPWFNTTLIVKILEYVPGLQPIINLYNDFVVTAVRNTFQQFINSTNGWIVILIGLTPIFVVIGVVLFVYYRNKKYFY